ncbi:tRNA 5-methylaminomethyl-2-thiouridine biosynthesis bifunctional protein MnmC [Bibersteinia trehalosi USDA-ARS-USMARC-190]|uniref:tRNA 5-methylaminomethyl-2-thiouridine biosynthesis bifunctional protein MnmC n=1 Tax=Bibersteinia trehalosi USDA-ARS-USMARC-190 TaxID=1263832 RepID=W0R8K8_BIBTR|nr:bifunctional tRNA (5-methylaminomethyl-2-thiouridine)(34)-methyltransferase MnmD/FAD-dependent 5-carboxymethylaminomethyl-2-thiouridine(34) oxidoreductase MnmC [Bibersteinia trehalosi]AHG86650.1 tRNA 5-methylaminomethyl-2-thiouridine biosynthesis bifunctional protein MnmC [Bibersteinia trehalosi USDA-ARS-USMARC-190]
MNKLTFASLSFNADNTPVSEQFDDIYFSTQDGLAESYYVFQEGNQLWQKWQNHSRAHFVIAETGFGTGLNFFAVADKFRQFRAAFPQSPLQRLYFISFEKYPLTAEQLATIQQNYPQFAEFSQKLTACWQPRQTGCERYHFDAIYLDLWFGEMAESLLQLGDYHNGKVDCWFLDGFSPDKNPDMWNEHLYRQMFRLTRKGGSFATFTASSNVRRGLQAVGFEVKKRKGFGKKREMLWGEKTSESEMSVLRFLYYKQPEASEHNEVAIIGGGVASLFLAWSLLERGIKVTLYCKDAEPARNASGNLQGALYPQLSDDDSRNVRFYVHSFDYALRRLAQITSLVPFEQGLTGVALCAYSDKAAKKLQKIAEQGWNSSLFALVSAAQLSEKIGLPVTDNGAFIAQGGWLSPRQLVQNGFVYLQKLGLNIVFNHHVEKLEYQNCRWQWLHNGQYFSHQNVVLANGHLLKQFEQTEGIPLYPVRGQVSHIPTNRMLTKLKCVVCYDGYLTPKSAGDSHCVGASHIRDNQETHFSLEEHQQNFAKLSQNLTACDWAKSADFSQNQAKVGIRSAFRDRMPMFGSMPNFAQQKQQYANLYNQLRRKEPIEMAAFYPQLYLVAGLGSRGLTTAPLLGEMLASQICGEPLPLAEELHQVLMPNRSWVRNWLKGRCVE